MSSSALPAALFDFTGQVARADCMEQLQQRYLDGVGAFVPGSAAGLYLLNPFTRGADGVAARGVSDFFLSRYEEIGRHRDPVLAEALRREDAVHNHQLMDLERWKQQPVYGEVFGLHRMNSLLEAPLVVDGKALGTLNFGRPAGQGPFTEAERQLASVIARLMALAIDAVRARDRERRDLHGVVAALDLCGDALFITDLQTAERRLNVAGRRLLSRLPEGEVSLDDLMLEPVLPGRVLRQEVPVRLLDGATARLRLRSVASAEDPAVAVTFLSLVAASAHTTPAMAECGLTPREHEVAELAAAGLRDSEIAEQLVLSTHTVKHYLKTVYGKAGVRSRVELARLGHE